MQTAVYATEYSFPSIQKGSNEATLSQNYRPIALASSLSKVLERLIISKYETFFHSNALQFGFKRGHSTSLCTATVKNVASHYMHNGSAVLGCFLDASKAFDLVDHGILFQKLLDRGLPLPVINFLLSWYIILLTLLLKLMLSDKVLLSVTIWLCPLVIIVSSCEND